MQNINKLLLYLNMENWKDIEGFEGLYQISDLGRVKSLERIKIGTRNRIWVRKERILKAGSNRGYWQVLLCKNKIGYNKSVHILLAKAFISNPNNYPEIDHRNANPSDLRIINLRWCTHKMNMQYSLDAGRGNKRHGDTHTSAKLTDELIKEIKMLYQTGEYTHRKLAEKYGVDHSNITRALNNKNWKHVA